MTSPHHMKRQEKEWNFFRFFCSKDSHLLIFVFQIQRKVFGGFGRHDVHKVNSAIGGWSSASLELGNNSTDPIWLNSVEVELIMVFIFQEKVSAFL